MWSSVSSTEVDWGIHCTFSNFCRFFFLIASVNTRYLSQAGAELSKFYTWVHLLFFYFHVLLLLWKWYAMFYESFPVSWVRLVVGMKWMLKSVLTSQWGSPDTAAPLFFLIYFFCGYIFPSLLFNISSFQICPKVTAVITDQIEKYCIEGFRKAYKRSKKAPKHSIKFGKTLNTQHAFAYYPWPLSLSTFVHYSKQTMYFDKFLYNTPTHSANIFHTFF